MKRYAFFLLSVAVLFVACQQRRENGANGSRTDTIAPAPAQPASSGTDEALTQTVNVEDGRSEEDGGALNNTATAKTPPTTRSAPASATSTQTAPPPKPQKKR